MKKEKLCKIIYDLETPTSKIFLIKISKKTAVKNNKVEKNLLTGKLIEFDHLRHGSQCIQNDVKNNFGFSKFWWGKRNQ